MNIRISDTDRVTIDAALSKHFAIMGSNCNEDPFAVHYDFINVQQSAIENFYVDLITANRADTFDSPLLANLCFAPTEHYAEIGLKFATHEYTLKFYIHANELDIIAVSNDEDDEYTPIGPLNDEKISNLDWGDTDIEANGWDDDESQSFTADERVVSNQMMERLISSAVTKLAILMCLLTAIPTTILLYIIAHYN